MGLAELRPEQSYLPNKVPRACSVLDNQYNTHYELAAADSILASNVRGFMVCDEEARIGLCDEESCAPMYAEGFFDELAQTYAKSEKSETRMKRARKRLSVYGSFSKSVVRSGSFAMLVLGVVIGLVAVLMGCHVWSRVVTRKMKVAKEWSGIIE